MRRSFLAFVVFVLTFRALAQAADPVSPKLRLPGGVAPTRYAVELWLDPEKETFEGRIEIEISLKEETGTVWLNAKELDVRMVFARRAVGAQATRGSAAAAGNDYLGLTFEGNLSSGPWTLVLEYAGRIDSKDTDGVFRQREGGDWYVFTQFEAIFARRAFPCFDEPSYKTPWQLTIHAPRRATRG